MDKSINKIADILDTVNSREDYNIVADLQSLERLFGVLKPKEYRKKLKEVIAKYETSELTEIRAALLDKCRQGDTNAIRLYLDSFKPTTSGKEDDGLAEALLMSGKAAFDEN